MLQTVLLPCHLPKAEAGALNRESGRIYSRVLVTHYRVYRKHGIWLSPTASQKLDDFYSRADPPLLHAHSKDAANKLSTRRSTPPTRHATPAARPTSHTNARPGAHASGKPRVFASAKGDCDLRAPRASIPSPSQFRPP